MEHRIALHAAVVAEEFAVGPLRLHIAPLVEIAFQHQLRISGYEDVVGDALHHRQGLVAEGSHEAQLVDRQPHGGRDMIERMGADDEAHRQPLAARQGRLVDRA